MSETDAALLTWVRGYVAEASREKNLDAFVAEVDAAILAETPELASNPVLVAELHASTKAQFHVFLSLLEREKQELLLPPQAVDLALSIARRQLELGVLLKVYRVAAAAVWEFFARVAAAVPAGGPDRTDVLVYLWGHGGTWINEAIEQLITVFADEREATLHGALARRTETVHALLRGDPVPVDTATSDLGHPVRGPQTALVLWTDDGDSAEAVTSLQGLATALATAAGGTAVSIPAGRREVWAWITGRVAPDVSTMREVVDAASGQIEPHVAVGQTAAGAAGFRQSHREAIAAQRLAVRSPSAGRLTAHAEHELACLVAGDDAGVRTLIGRELGGLAGAEKGLDRLRETVATFLRHGGSVDLTASQLIVHKNTVRYRLAQAEDLIGHPLTERRTEIAVALECLGPLTEPPAV
ncbi:hypothetical protein HMPREF0063_12127 [Aeromicrobium marinum DSM 15272]|uniref:PucR C-terminal helix-turn-helix domain-containing protein n=1 Tax=Aeromicrobium marinum DSM 15272 TaxID=585531 RepID=E2SCG5_9ACTN|nr:helix-turn-helix domain-containing protein [Aeromicrobium marinum]EFQ82918.1 hypothetical protein HMPREF0063_12127 [Aeromicrobium marinum DSM 15272]